MGHFGRGELSLLFIIVIIVMTCVQWCSIQLQSLADTTCFSSASCALCCGPHLAGQRAPHTSDLDLEMMQGTAAGRKLVRKGQKSRSTSGVGQRPRIRLSQSWDWQGAPFPDATQGPGPKGDRWQRHERAAQQRAQGPNEEDSEMPEHPWGRCVFRGGLEGIPSRPRSTTKCLEAHNRGNPGHK